LFSPCTKKQEAIHKLMRNNTGVLLIHEHLSKVNMEHNLV